MTSADDIAFAPSDAWLLLAIWYAGGEESAELKEILGAGDFINHAVFTLGELRNGLARLTAAGYIADRSGRFQVVGEALRFLSSQGPRRAVHTDRDNLARFLNASAQRPDEEPLREDPAWPYPSLSAEDLREAERQSRSDFWRTYRVQAEQDRKTS